MRLAHQSCGFTNVIARDNVRTFKGTWVEKAGEEGTDQDAIQLYTATLSLSPSIITFPPFLRNRYEGPGKEA